eukprot:CAMPEP_0177723292 /NCGR_PEP_ID=MMETSP0484_2-20121128/18136_1 /TAXON_ID=354590 /ORGANISM="Rhodomonas lens, Strain RHODO" /LENGTH=142 /DNA_ID=CAMNT_0019235721 /DNA_START=290 /DNA_END=715 /DNA_ORIENTATION=-
MKLRLRTPDGGTTRFEAEGSETLQAVIDRLKTMLPVEVFTSTCGISLNKKEVFDESRTLEACGIRGGDLLHLLQNPGATPPTSTAARTSSLSSSSLSSSSAAVPTSRNLFGLPTSAPTGASSSQASSTSTTRMVQDRQGRVW